MVESTGKPAWYKATAAYQQPSPGRAIWQLINTFIPYALVWYLSYQAIRRGYSYWLVLPLLLLGAGLQIRIFIFFHDCCHGSFFASRTANALLGYLSGILTLTPYEQWRHSHAIHHACVGDLDRRGTGDVWTMTVREYQDAPWWVRLAYRVFRHPLVTFGVGPTMIFLFLYRLPTKGARRRDRISVYIVNLAIVSLLLLAHATIGLRALALIYLPMVLFSTTLGVWLFYVQHQFEGTYWADHEGWKPMRAALDGSSFYKLPKVLQWFTGNIGFHHVHHVRARIPNYYLEKCHEAIGELTVRQPLTPAQSLRCMWLDLWDEQRQELVSFRSLKSAPS